MALTPCPACGKEVSTAAASCPNCGHPLASQPIKEEPKPQPKPVDPKTAYGCGTVILIILLIAMLPKCGKDAEKTTAASSSQDTKEAAYNHPWDGSVYQVERWLKKNLKDPGSFEAIEWSPVKKKPDGGYVVRCKYRAKNSFGGYVIEEQIFMLDSTGEVITAVNMNGK